MKWLKISMGITVLLLLMQGYAYINLSVSEKFETQPEGHMEITTEVKRQVEERAQEIEGQKQQTKIISLILVVALIGQGIWLYRKLESSPS